MDNRRYWFRAKRVGWGWDLPLTWEGWTVLGVWLGISTAVVGSLRAPAHRGLHFFIVIGMIAALAAICFWKGEPPNQGLGNQEPRR
jgi:hypothetical protein